MKSSNFQNLTSLLKTDPLRNLGGSLSSETSLGKLEMLSSAIEAASIIAYTDKSGRITHVNENFCRISGYSENELIGNTHQIVNSGFHPKEFFISMWQMISQGEIWRGEICNRRKDGTLYWVDTTIIPFPSGGPYNSRYVAIRNNITEKKSLQEELKNEHIRRVEHEKLASLGEFTAGIAHELGNPIAALQGRAEMLLTKCESEDSEMATYSARTAKTMLDLTQRMTSILRGMLTMARDGSNDPFQLASVSKILRDTVEFGQQKLSRKKIEIVVEDLTEEHYINCRETQITQILVNLINNAVDAIQDLPVKWIRISTSLAPTYLSIFVTDSGSGIQEEIRDKIFAKFFTTKEIGKGTGLGLHISRSIAHAHGGDLLINSDYPNTRFEIRLPLSRSEEPDLTKF